MAFSGSGLEESREGTVLEWSPGEVDFSGITTSNLKNELFKHKGSQAKADGGLQDEQRDCDPTQM